MPVDDTCAGCHGNSRAREGLIASSMQRFCPKFLSHHLIYDLVCIFHVIFVTKVVSAVLKDLFYVNEDCKMYVSECIIHYPFVSTALVSREV